jgi:hypothetical protein
MPVSRQARNFRASGVGLESVKPIAQYHLSGGD